jgi:hypothetical protein
MLSFRCNVPRSGGARHNERMAHTFLFVPAVWSVTGTVWRADGHALEAQGRTEIAHREGCWLLSGTLKVLGAPPVEFVHAYLIEPPGPEGNQMKWTFENATYGKLRGLYAVIGSSILSVFGCDTSGYHGTEHLGQIDADNYRTAGLLLLHDRVVYSWQLDLKRPPARAGGRRRTDQAGSEAAEPSAPAAAGEALTPDADAAPADSDRAAALRTAR